MIEIELSYIWGNDDPTYAVLVEEFSQQYGVKVRLRRFDWTTAWADLFTMASQGHGSDVSSIGSTWVRTLAKLDALRPFKSSEIAQIGGTSAFIEPSWQGAKIFGDERIWSIPWMGWMYVVCYRKDIFQEMGIDPSKAFATPQSFQEMLAMLKTSPLEIPWLNPNATHPYSDFIHIAASWVWKASGEFISPAGDKALFASPQAIAGLACWLDSCRAVPEQYQQLGPLECVDMFLQKDVAATLIDIRAANLILHADFSHVQQENIGFSTLADTPWVGGSNFIIWEHTRIYPEREHAAVELVKFLSREESGLKWRQDSNLLPTRMDALEKSYPPGNPLHEVIVSAARYGRPYYNAPHWRRVESQLSLALGTAVKDAQENPSADSATILRNCLEPLARRLDIILGT